ncbi:MAG: HEAT repeat domain-containing protein [Planctomycetota bacterium]
MRRAIVLTALLLSALPALADGFRDAKKAFQTAFAKPLPAKEREFAVRKLAAFDTKDAAKLLVGAIPETRREYDLLLVERAAVQSGKIEFPDGGPAPRLGELKRLIDRELRVIDAIDDALAGMREKRTVQYLFRDALPREKNSHARVSVAKALGRIGDAAAVPALIKALRDKSERVRGAAVLSLGRLKTREAVPALLDLLDADSWTIRAATCEALGRIGDLRAVIPLIERLPAEEGRLAEDVGDALAKLTGQRFGTATDAWNRWLEKNRELIEAGGPLPKPPPPPEEKPEAEDGYYGIPVLTRKAIFILDISESMSYSATKDQEKPKPGEDSRLDVAKRELKKALLGFDPKGRFTVVAFHNRLTVWKDRMMDATEVNRKAAAGWAVALKPTGTTNIYAALEKAFAIAGMGVTDRHYAVSADSIYLLSDGAPTNEDLTDDDPDRILRAVREWNRLGRVKIHTIGLRGHAAYFMSTLAEENGGTYVVR